MRRLVIPICLALATFALPSLGRPALAQQSSKDLVSWRGATTEASATSVLLPLQPPVAVTQFTAKGSENLLGNFTATGHYLLRLGADGTPLSITDGIWTITAANGDTIHGSTSGLIRPHEKPGFVTLDLVSFVTGGRGRFAGASGHLFVRAEVELATGKGGFSWEGMISPPKP